MLGFSLRNPAANLHQLCEHSGNHRGQLSRSLRNERPESGPVVHESQMSSGKLIISILFIYVIILFIYVIILFIYVIIFLIYVIIFQFGYFYRCPVENGFENAKIALSS